MNQMSREQLELRANTTRSRLLSTVDELDRRRHELTNLAVQVKKAALPVAIGAGLVVVAFAGAVVWGLSRARRTVTGKVLTPFLGAKVVRKAWSKPRPKATAWYANVARSVLMTALSYVARQLAMRTISAATEPRMTQGIPPGTNPLARRHDGSPQVITRT